MGKYETVSMWGLIKRCISLIRRFTRDEKIYVKQEAKILFKETVPGLILCVMGIVFLVLGLCFLLVATVLFLNMWFTPWMSALLVTISLILCGAALALTGYVIIKKELSQAGSSLKDVKEHFRWLKKN